MSGIKEIARVVREFAQIAPELNFKLAEDDEKTSLGLAFEESVRRFPDNSMLLCDDREWTYREFNEEVNRFAGLLEDSGIGRGDTVALVMENRPEFVLSMLAVMKLGASCSLINHGLTGPGLVHCLKSTGASACIFGEERRAALEEVIQDLGLKENSFFWFRDSEAAASPTWAVDSRPRMAHFSSDNPAVTSDISAGEVGLYVFTSGTTGLPKAAVMPHRRILAAGQILGRLGLRVKPSDRLYLCLPIYHITGLGPGLFGFIIAGGSVVLRRKFSATSFWPEVQKYQANAFVYVGELCRYLTAQAPCPEERDNPLEKMLGNGLRPDVWDEFKSRFQVPRICEIYGSSEGNVTFANLLNKDRTIGAALSPVVVASYDAEREEIRRNSAGRVIEVPVGEPGLLLGKITSKFKFDGYTDSGATEKKIITDVKKEGDRWFNTGDLIRQIDVGFALGLKHFQFVDRTGDTFRWRAENVSTNEVAEVLNQHPQIHMANVYGVEVPGAEGRAGMVAFAMQAEEEFDAVALAELTNRDLPAYARPVFVRIQRNMETTGTFKLLKVELREQSFHLESVGNDEILVRKPRSTRYEPLDEAYYQVLLKGAAGY